MSEQMGLDYESFSHARACDPVTSKEAAVRAKRFATTHADQIHQVLVERGPLSAHEVAMFLPLNYVQVDRRFIDLERAGRAKRTEQTRGTPSGGRATVWAAV